MPELPDLRVYCDALERHCVGHPLRQLDVRGFALLKTWETPASAFADQTLERVDLLGKRLVFHFSDELVAVLHLMVAGRLRWMAPGAKGPGRITQARLVFDPGVLVLTEAGKKRRATLHLHRGAAALAAHDRGGVDPLACDTATFRATLRRERRTLKRALTDPRLLAGIGGAYADEILHRARLSPVQLTSNLDDAALNALHAATQQVLRDWIARLRDESGGDFPPKVTAFHPAMAVHGRFRQPCPTCGVPIQRIVYASRETNYCPGCQTGGRVLADRALSRLLKADWPRTLEELEGHGTLT